MIIKQEDTSPVQDLFDKSGLVRAFKGIEEMSGDIAVDTELYVTYCEETIKLLKSLKTDIEALERDENKKKNRERFKENLSRGSNI